MSHVPGHPFDKQLSVWRILDANANRAGEGLRVLEDYCRFVCDDAHLSRSWKELRHRLQQVLAALGSQNLLVARDALGDVGAEVTAADEYQRADAWEVAAASQKRVEQSLRCLEEYTKPQFPRLSPQIEQLRYQAYTIGRAMSLAVASDVALRDCRLYVLIGGRPSPERGLLLCHQLLQAGVRFFQLRDKELDDRTLVEFARGLREVTRQGGAKLIINDRPDIAHLCGADGVHVGQDELSVKDARSLLGADRLVGVSTHTVEQARQAVWEGANYIGCGPTFPSSTKNFDTFAGTEFLCQVAAEIRLPAFAIGGISLENLADVTATGFRRVAVSSAVTAAADPAAAAQALQRGLENADRA